MAKLSCASIHLKVKGLFPVLVFSPMEGGGSWAILMFSTPAAGSNQFCTGYGGIRGLPPGTEHKFPTAVNDCHLATKWVRKCPLLAGDAGRVAVGVKARAQSCGRSIFNGS